MAVSARDGWYTGFHFLKQNPVPGLGNPDEVIIADVRVEPLVRDPRLVWVEVNVQNPVVALPGLGVFVQGPSGGMLNSDSDVSRIVDCAQKAHELLDRVPAFLGREGD